MIFIYIKLMNKAKGDDYELYIRNHIINNLNKQAFLWSHTPETILIESGIIGSHNEHRLRRKENKLNPLHDTGIDIIQVNEDNSISLIQCKNGYENGLVMSDLAGFGLWMASIDSIKGYVYYTSKLSHNITSLPKNRIEYIKQPMINKNQMVKNNNFVLDDGKLKYQLEAKQLADIYYKDNIKGVISMPCGTGKTYTSYFISNSYKQIIIISPLKQFAQQNLERFIEYGFTGETLLIDSDGCRNLDEINKFIELNESFIISSTFKSVDILVQIMDKLTNPFIIIDEFHNLSKNNVMSKNNEELDNESYDESDNESVNSYESYKTNVNEEEDDMYKIIHNNHKKLFMSATPRVYEIEDEDDEEFEKYTFGEIIFKMSFNEAITNNYITDYNIWLPSIHEDNTELTNELSIYDIDDTIKSKCMFLYSCLLNNGSRKCIIYCIDTNEINLMKKAIEKLNEFYLLDIEMNEITSSTTKKNREIRLNNFTKSKKIYLMFSVRILDECIDIPACDSIYITYPSNSKIRTIQRLSRCIRIDKNNKFKKGNIFIWCDEYSEILETLGGIKEYDIYFKNKIKVNENRFYKQELKDDFMKDKQLITNYIMGIKEFKFVSWNDKLDLVKKYINENHKRPSTHDKNNEIKQMGKWIQHQQEIYKKKSQIMKQKEIYDEWTKFLEEYRDYFLDNNELWYNMFEKVKEYINENHKRPNSNDKNNEIKQMGKWIQSQQQNYKKKKNIMKQKEIYDEWTKFMEEYGEYFLDNNELWYNMLEKVKEYINENHKRPSSESKNNEIKQIGQWIQSQQTNYKNKKHIMKQQEIYNEWSIFLKEYKIYFK
jgi:superfamily II DNA or RNA helicase